MDIIHSFPARVVALTGTIGSGKSAVASLLAAKGAFVLDADLFAREVVTKGSQGLQEVIQHFGPEFLTIEGELDRRALAGLVFAHPEARKALNAIVHPHVRALLLRRLGEVPDDKMLVVYVVPLLFEAGNIPLFIKKIIVVIALDSVCRARITDRDKITETEAEARLLSQMPSAEKVQRADYVLHNDGTFQELEEKVAHLWNWLAQVT